LVWLPPLIIDTLIAQMTYSDDLKWVVVSLAMRSKTVEEISELMELPTRTVYRILQIYRDFGTITGRRCELDPRLIRVSTIIILIIQYITGVLLVVKKDWYLAELRKELVEAGAGEISIATTWRYLDRANGPTSRTRRYIKLMI
jgi:transcription initiation factor IIE alpha subunit